MEMNQNKSRFMNKRGLETFWFIFEVKQLNDIKQFQTTDEHQPTPHEMSSDCSEKKVFLNLLNFIT